jgi:fatty acid amide hydrolase
MTADGGLGLQRALGRDKADPRVKQLIDFGKMPRPMLAAMMSLLGAMGQPSLVKTLRTFKRCSAWEYMELTEAVTDYRQRFAAALDRDQIDVIISPACALPAFTHGASADLGVAGAYTIIYNVLGYPAGVAPFTRVRPDEAVGRSPSRDRVEQAAFKVEQGSAGLPIGVQVAARPWREHVALAAMAALEGKGN